MWIYIYGPVHLFFAIKIQLAMTFSCTSCDIFDLVHVQVILGNLYHITDNLIIAAFFFFLNQLDRDRLQRTIDVQEETEKAARTRSSTFVESGAEKCL